MGSDAHLVVDGGTVAALDDAEARLHELERRWSRFVADSEISRLNRQAGAPVVVGPDTVLLVEHAVAGWSRTGHRFDPTVGRAVIAAGYDRSFDELVERVDQVGPGGRASEHGPGGASMSAPGCRGLVVVPRLGIVRAPHGVHLDPGGIGKGLAADLVATALVADGATGALVSVGGDLRVAGVAPDHGWTVEIDHGRGPVGRVGLCAGAVATSSILRRRWTTPRGVRHHVIDPRTGRPTSGAALACTVVAGEAWWAEVLATATLVAWEEADGHEVVAQLLGDAAGLVTTAAGSVVRVGSPDVLLHPTAAA